MEAIVKARVEANEVRKMARTQDAVAEERRLAAEERRVAAEERKVALGSKRDSWFALLRAAFCSQQESDTHRCRPARPSGGQRWPVASPVLCILHGELHVSHSFPPPPDAGRLAR